MAMHQAMSLPLFQPRYGNPVPSLRDSVCSRFGSTMRSRCSMSTYTPNSTPFPCLEIIRSFAINEFRYKNFLYSPCAIQLALSLLANGSKGSTREELLDFLEADNLDELNSVNQQLLESLTKNDIGTPLVDFLAGVWIDKSLPLNPNFRNTVQTIYNGNAKNVYLLRKQKDVIHTVNKWAAEATNQCVKSVLPGDDTIPISTNILLPNALHFRGRWSEPLTTEGISSLGKFELLNGDYVDVPYMSNRGYKYLSTFQDFQVLRLPYQMSTVSMYIILPTNRHLGLRLLLKKVGSDPSFMDKYVQKDMPIVKMREFYIPKFKFAYGFEASEILYSLGLLKCFSPEAEFHEMVLDLEQPDDRLLFSKVHHKAQIEVSEEGTEAACISADHSPRLGPLSTGINHTFVADHAFLFIMRDDESGSVLFMGQVVNPLLE